MKFVLAAVAIGASALCHAQSLGTIFTDLWWNPDESGWGVTVDHQDDVMFLTFFIYRDRSPYWVVALLRRSPPTDEFTRFVFSGELIETQGPRVRGDDLTRPFDPAEVTTRTIGFVTFRGDAARTALSAPATATPWAPRSR